MPSACSKIRHIVRLRQMLRRWRSKAARRLPSDVPAGHVAVTVGSSCRRFVVRTTHLNHPVFQKLLLQAEEEFGFTNSGPLCIPCDESLFQDLLRFLDRNGPANNRFLTFEDFQRYCHVGFQTNVKLLADSRPLLDGFSDNSIW